MKATMILALFAFPASLAAQELKLEEIDPNAPFTPLTNTCIETPDQANCNRFAGCFGKKGTYFHGRAFGRGKGIIEALTSEGQSCTGVWTSRNKMGLGQANFECSNGESGVVYFFYQDEYSGTAEGSGWSSKGRFLKMWSGNNLQKYFPKSKTTGLATLSCGPADIPVS